MNPESPLDNWKVLTAAGPRDHMREVARVLEEVWEEQPVLRERLDGETAWLDLYVSGDGPTVRLYERFRASWPELVVRISDCPPRDWADFWRHHFHTRPVGHRLLLVPAWEAEAAAADPTDRIPILLEPGLSFGTGDHFTTRFCLEAVETAALSQETTAPSFLDLGTGSGVLAIAAAKFGFDPILAVDNDPICIRQTVDNAERNGVADRLHTRVQGAEEVPLDRRWDLVCANILADVLTGLAPRLLALTGRRLALSGILESQADAVAEAFVAAGGREVGRDGDGEWCGLHITPEHRPGDGGLATDAGPA